MITHKLNSVKCFELKYTILHLKDSQDSQIVCNRCKSFPWFWQHQTNVFALSKREMRAQISIHTLILAGRLVTMKHLGKAFLWFYLHQMKWFASLMRKMRAQISIQIVILEISCWLSGQYEAFMKWFSSILPTWNRLTFLVDTWYYRTNFHWNCDTWSFMLVIWSPWSTQEKISFDCTCMKWSDLLGWCVKWERRCPFKLWKLKFHAGHLVTTKHSGKDFLWFYLHDMKGFTRLMREMRVQISIQIVILEISCWSSGHYEAPRKRSPLILPAWKKCSPLSHLQNGS